MDIYEFKASSRTARTVTQRNPVLKKYNDFIMISKLIIGISNLFFFSMGLLCIALKLTIKTRLAS